VNPRYEMPDKLYFGGGGDTFGTPLAVPILIIGMLLVFAVPRRYVIVPLLVAGLLIPVPVTLVVGGFHFNAFRLLLLAGWLRVLLRRETRFGRVIQLDKILVAWAISGAVMFCVLWGWGAISNRLGFLYTTLGSYFLMRCVIRDKGDVLRLVKTLAIFLVALTPFLIWEHVTAHNALSVLGAQEASAIRNGDVRAQGPFLHPIICGTLGAMLLPIFIGLWWQGGRDRLVGAVGVVSSLAITIVSASSTPVMTLAAGLAGILLWPARRHLRWLRWGSVITLIGLHFLMKAPVWYLIARVGAATGGSGWHRATLIDNFFAHFGEWWLCGTRNNADWGYYMWDVDNAFVNNGLQGGLVTFLLFIALFVYGFKLLGRARRKSERSPHDARLIWAIGCALFANATAFFGIFYFDQSILAWYGLLVMIPAAGTLATNSKFERLSEVASARGLDLRSPLHEENPAPAF